jgi:EpsI family protein
MNDHSKTNFQPYAYLLFLPPLLATAFLYRETLVRLGKGLITYENSHGLVILAISLYLIWSKRRELERQPVKPNLIGGSIITGLGCALLVAGQYGSSVILTDFSLIVTLFGLVWILLGTNHLKTMLLPIGYLLFAYPLFDYMPSNVVVHLQHISAWLAANMLKILGITVYHNVTYLELPWITLQVAQGCAGLNHIAALLAVSVMLAHYSLDGLLKQIVLVSSALFIGLAANGLRVAVIGVISSFSQPGPLHGPSDILYVSFVFIIGLAAVILLNYFLGGTSRSLHHTKQRAEYVGGEPSHDSGEPYPSGTTVRNRGSLFIVPLLIATLIPISAYAYADIFRPRPVPLANSLSNIPMQIGGWEATCSEKTDFIPSDVQPDEKLVRCYQSENGEEVHLYVAYFTHQRRNHKVTDFSFSYNEGDAFYILSAGDKITLRRAIPNNPGTRNDVYFWYSIDGKVISNRLEAKLTLLANGIINRRTNGRLVVIEIENRQENSKDKTRHGREVIETFYPVIQGQMGE